MTVASSSRTRGPRREMIPNKPASLVPVLEQLPRFFDFGKIMPATEIDEKRRRHLGHRLRSAIRAVEARKSKCAAQREGFRLLASGYVQCPLERCGRMRWAAFGRSRLPILPPMVR